MSNMITFQYLAILEGFNAHIVLLVVLTTLTTLLLVTLLLVVKRIRRAQEKLKPRMEILDSGIRFNQELLVERGSLVYARIVTPYGTVQSQVKWVGSKTVFQAMGVHVKELCSNPPHVMKDSRGVYVKIPALRVLTENLKNTIIACFDTRGLRARGLVNLVYTSGYARAEVELSKGTLSMSVNWVTLEPFSTRVTKETLHVELCSKEFNTCIEFLRMVKPGTGEATLHYPETLKVLAGCSGEKVFDHLYELTKNIPSVFGIDDVEVRVNVKSGLRIVAESKAPLVQA